MSVPEGAERASDSDTDYGNIRKTFATRDLPRHLALFYRSQSEQLTVASAFVADGLARDERCLYLADQNDPRDVREAFERHGIDVDGRKADGQLDLVDAAQVYTDGAFDPSAAIAQLETRARGSVEEGYTGFRVAGENTWSFDVEDAFESVIDFEIRFGDTCTDLPVTALCQYDVEKFDDAVLGKVLQTHERVTSSTALRPWHPATG
ncbi:MAG: MEDS domain-containing protein [Halovenus sp.]